MIICKVFKQMLAITTLYVGVPIRSNKNGARAAVWQTEKITSYFDLSVSFKLTQ